MRWYAQRPGRATRQVVGDVFVVVWTVVWVLIGRSVDGIVRALADPVRETGLRAEETARALRDAAGQAGGVPGVGDGLRRPFDDAAGSIDGIVVAARDQVALIETAATVLGIVTFAIPFAVVVAVWLPRRLRFLRTTHAVSDLVDTEAGVDLLALRAMATTPLSTLRRISDDPVRAWRDGDLAVITALAEVELRRLGLRHAAVDAGEPTTSASVDPAPVDPTGVEPGENDPGGEPSAERDRD